MAEQVALERQTISLEAAHELISAAIGHARESGKAFAIAVCDEGGVQKAFARMDGAPLLACEIACNKAYTAVAYGIPTDQWYEFIKDDPPLAAGIVHTPRLVVFGGGYPIVVGGAVIGGIGVSGGHYTEDMKCAQAALAAISVA